ncbi:MAG: helicase-associated domain-containing protein [Deltaproteobacteria bacterium]|nr:helicase-associated domain-containing protein [Deltaproteobacteria bacterium]
MTDYTPDNPLIVQGDHTILVEVNSPRYEAARNELIRFAELVKSPEHIHTYRITPLSIWNARAAGIPATSIIDALHEFTKYPVPEHILVEINDFAARFGRLKLRRHKKGITLSADNEPLAEEIVHTPAIRDLLASRISQTEFLIRVADRGRIKQALIQVGFPAEDLAGYVKGERVDFSVRTTTSSGAGFSFRPYQQQAADIFYAKGADQGGAGVIVLPCGAGKTIVGIGCMAQLQTSTLILTTNVTAIRQWKQELMDKTTLSEEDIGEYSGNAKEIRQVTIATYQIMTYRPNKEGDFPHLTLFDDRNWGLIIYDEVHMLPAPVFQVTAGLQARRRLGLTATLVREDGKEEDVFALIGPKKVDVPWKEMEQQGWIAKARCCEIRIPLPEDLRMPYAVANKRRKFRISSENPAKQALIREIMARHKGKQILLIGMYIDQLKAAAKGLDIPLITGSTSQKKRDSLYEDFKDGKISTLAVSKVANFAVDLPDAAVAIQISGTFGSRQEEAQRLGRILRPKPGENQAYFYSLVTQDTVEQDFALKRQLFLCEQGYEYAIRTEGSLMISPSAVD